MKEYCKEKILEMLENITDEKFLNQIRIILKRHIERTEHEEGTYQEDKLDS